MVMGKTQTACAYFCRFTNHFRCRQWASESGKTPRASYFTGEQASAGHAANGERSQWPVGAKEPKPKSNGDRRRREIEDADCVAADIFSITIREYSAGEHVPRAVIAPRRPTVSHEASASPMSRLRLKYKRRRSVWPFLLAERPQPPPPSDECVRLRTP
jgi:hypothetical protein